jgi:hypothetical protein
VQTHKTLEQRLSLGRRALGRPLVANLVVTVTPAPEREWGAQVTQGCWRIVGILGFGVTCGTSRHQHPCM